MLLLFAGAFAGWFTPEQIHLSWTENENEMRVTWNTLKGVGAYMYAAYRPILCDEVDQPYNYIHESGDSINVGTGTGWWERTIYKYSAVMTNIRPECTYEYMVGTTLLWSDTYYFKGTTPDYNKPYEQLEMETDVLIFGDWGIGPMGKETSIMMNNFAEMRLFDAVLHIGDMSYDLHDYNGRTGDIWNNEKQPISANFPYMVIPGNHEDYNNATIYKDRYEMPENYANDGEPLFYSFNLGLAHYVLYNTEIYFGTYDEGAQQTQYNWLKADLEQANLERDERPWIIALTHHPMYSTDPYQNGDNAKLHPAFEELLNEQAVDWYFAGHVHRYERDMPVYKNATVHSSIDEKNYHFNANAPLYITCGGAGNREGHSPVQDPYDWTVLQSATFGFGNFHVYNKTHTHYQQYDSATQSMIDDVWLVKDRPRYQFPQDN